MLSREYYYLGTQLPVDRFLTFYYGHPGFHINNILVILSVQLFMFTLVFLGTMNKELFICQYSASGQFLASQAGCYNLVPVYDWIKRSVISIFIVFFIGKSCFHACTLHLSCMALLLISLAISFPAALPTRIDGARSRSSRRTIGKAFQFTLSRLRSLRHSNLVAFNLEQHDLRRSSVHCHRTRFRHDKDLLRHSVLSIRRTEYLPWNEDATAVGLYHVDHMASASYVALFLQATRSRH